MAQASYIATYVVACCPATMGSGIPRCTAAPFCCIWVPLWPRLCPALSRASVLRTPAPGARHAQGGEAGDGSRARTRAEAIDALDPRPSSDSAACDSRGTNLRESDGTLAPDLLLVLMVLGGRDNRTFFPASRGIGLSGTVVTTKGEAIGCGSAARARRLDKERP